MDDFIWLEKFTALIQVISAINFTYILTHFPKTVYDKILNEEELTNKRFQSFIDGPLSKAEESIECMDPIVINGKDTIEHITQLKDLLNKYLTIWNDEKNKTEKIIQNIKEAKGIKCLFLFISVFCILDFFNIALVNIYDSQFVQVFIFWINLFSFAFTIWISFKIVFSRWKGREDNYCYNQTSRYIFYTLIFSVVFAIINEWIIAKYGVLLEIPIIISKAILWLCIILPLVPCLLSILLIVSNILRILIHQLYTRIKIHCGLWIIDRRKKKLEGAVRQITSGLGWK